MFNVFLGENKHHPNMIICLLAMIPQMGLSGLNGTFPSLSAVEFVDGVLNICAASLHHDLARPMRGHWLCHSRLGLNL
jgi:hypothetical protein